MIEPPADYDTSWKEALQQYFEPFLRFCFAEVHTLIDWIRQKEIYAPSRNVLPPPVSFRR